MSEEASPRVNPSVVFAQKATAIVRAAGFDPQGLDIEHFRRNAPEIFVNAVKGIYKTSIHGIHEPPASIEEKVKNCTLLLSFLSERCSNPLLSAVVPEEVADGTFRSIGILVNVIFGEGQRLWMEKKKKQDGIQDFEEIKKQLRPSSAPSGRESKYPPYMADRLNISVDFESQKRHIIMNQITDNKERYSLANSPQYQKNIKSLVMNNLSDKIKKLEDEIEQVTKEEKISTQLLKEFDEYVRGGGNSSSSPSKINSLLSPRARAFSIVAGGLSHGNTLQSDEVPELNEDADGLHPTSDAITRRQIKRPSSAPSRRSKSRETHGVFNRLFRAAQDSREAAIKAAEEEATREQALQRHRHLAGDRNVVDLEYTYDMSSGRRLPVSEAERLEAARKRAKEAMGLVVEDSNNVGKAGGKDAKKAIPVQPQPHPVVLNPRFEQSMDDYVQKMKLQRETKDDPPPKPIPSELCTARCFASYRSMQPLDLVFTVEHCHDCDKHCGTTRHNPAEYLNVAHTCLRWLAELSHSMRLCVRVGVVRFKAKLATGAGAGLSHAHNDRIGALEIQAAFRNRSGQVIYDLLHSKLTTTRWPSKSVIEKRLLSFATKAQIPTYTPLDSPTEYAGTANDGLVEYPVGVGPWNSTALCDDDWTMPDRVPIPRDRVSAEEETPERKKNKSLKKKPKTNKELIPLHEAPAPPPLHVQWAFDSRSSATELPIPVGSTVRVFNVPSVFGEYVERHPLLAVVKCAAPALSDATEPTISDVVVRLKYCSGQETRVPISDCVSIAYFTDREATYYSSIVPSELQALFILWVEIGNLCQTLPNDLPSSCIIENKVCSTRDDVLLLCPRPIWTVISSDDHTDSEKTVFLSRSSLFHHFRKICAWIHVMVSKFNLLQFSLDRHPITDVAIDLQLTYSEECLHWIQGGVSTIKTSNKALEKLVFDSICDLQPSESLSRTIFSFVAQSPVPVPAQPPNYQKLSKTELLIGAAQLFIFSFRWKLSFCCKKIYTVRKMNRSGRPTDVLLLSCIAGILHSLNCDDTFEFSKFVELVGCLGVTVADGDHGKMTQLVWRGMNPANTRYCNINLLIEYLTFGVTPASIFEDILEDYHPVIIYGAADLGIVWVKLVDQILEDPNPKTKGTARDFSHSCKMNNSKSLDALQTPGTSASGSIVDASSIGSGANSSRDQAMPLLAASQVTPIPFQLLSLAKSFLLKPDKIMLEVEYNQVAEAFDIHNLLSADEFALFLKNFWNIQTTVSRNTSTGSSSKGSKAQQVEVTEVITTTKTLNKLSFLSWLLDVDPMLVLINIVSMLANEFGGNRTLATRSFIQILFNMHAPESIFSEYDILALLEKMGMAVVPYSIISLCIHSFFLKCGRIDDNFMSVQVFANLLNVAAVDPCEDTTLLPPIRIQANEGASGNRRQSNISKLSLASNSRGNSENPSVAVSAVNSISISKSISDGIDNASARINYEAIASLCEGEPNLSRAGSNPSVFEENSSVMQSGRANTGRTPEVISVLARPVVPMASLVVPPTPAPTPAPALVKLPPWKSLASKDPACEQTQSVKFPTFTFRSPAPTSSATTSTTTATTGSVSTPLTPMAPVVPSPATPAKESLKSIPPPIRIESI